MDVEVSILSTELSKKHMNKEEGKKKVMKKLNLAAIFAALVIGIGTLSEATANAAGKTDRPSAPQSYSRLSKEVRKKLVTLPYYGVFDNLAYSINGNTVTLHGQVVRPSTKTDAARNVATIAGVARVVNNIQVLPLSSFDDSIRVRTLRTLQRTGSLYRYFIGSNPSLHIVVDRGHVTLTGVVSSNLDRQLAYMTAQQVPGTFSVTNDLRLDGEGEAR